MDMEIIIQEKDEIFYLRLITLFWMKLFRIEYLGL